MVTQSPVEEAPLSGARHFNRIGVLAIVSVSWTSPVFGDEQVMGDYQERQATAGWEPTIVAQVENYARISPRDLAAAEQQAARVYEAIGVRMIWVHGEVPMEDLRGLRVRVLLLPREMAERKIAEERIKNDVLGQANRPSHWAYIFTDRIAAVAVKRKQDGARVLGLVIAHEVGHIMLPAHSHSETGIMSGQAGAWSKKSQHFTPEQGAAIRSMFITGSRPCVFESTDIRPGVRSPKPC